MIEKELYDKAVKLTKTDYQLKNYICNEETFNWIIDDLIYIIEDLKDKIDNLIYIIEDLKDKIDNLEEDIRENYKYIGDRYE